MEDAKRQLSVRHNTIRWARLRSSSRGLMAWSNFPLTGIKSILIRHSSSLAGVLSRMNAEAQCAFVTGYPDGLMKSNVSTGNLLAKNNLGKFGWLANMERLMKAQTLGDTTSMEYMHGLRILEI
eukprot:Gb_20601 [translate_table: standard]